MSSPRCRRTHRAPPKPGSLRQFCCPAPCPSPLEFMAARSLLSLRLPVHARECLCIGTCVYECMFECMHACMLPFPSNLLLKHGNPGPSSSCWTWPSDAQHPSGALAARMRDGAKQTCRTLNGPRFLTHALTPFPPGPVRHHTEQTRGAEAGPG